MPSDDSRVNRSKSYSLTVGMPAAMRPLEGVPQLAQQGDMSKPMICRSRFAVSCEMPKAVVRTSISWCLEKPIVKFSCRSSRLGDFDI